MRRLIGAFLFAASLPACFSNNRCERASRAAVHAALLSESTSPVELLWDDRLERPTFFWGEFTLEGALPEEGVRRFIRSHPQLSLEEKDLTLAAEKTGRAGKYLRFSQTFQGLPVFRGEVIAQVRGASLRSLRLSQKQINTALDVNPTLSSKQALERAQESMSAIEKGSGYLSANEESGSARTPGIKRRGSALTQSTLLLPYGEESGSARTPPEQRSGSVLSALDNGEGNAASSAVPADADARSRFVRHSLKMTGEAALGVFTEGGARLAYRVLLSSESPLVAMEVFVDAHTGKILASQSLLKADEGAGFVFDPNPIASSGNHLLSDQQDETNQILSDERVSVALPGLDGTGFLQGRFADVQNASSRAQNLSLVFNFQRSDARFEEVMAYFHLDRAQQRIQSLGFFDVNNRVQAATVNAFAEDNSFYNPLNKRVSFGSGGVDDAEDADIIIHEYGHSIQDDQAPGFGVTEESRSMGEGFSDYLAGSFMSTLTNEVTEPACIGDWDSTAYDFREPPCLRRLDIPKHFPEHLQGEIHFDGEIWSAALFELRQAVGADVADALALEAHFSQAVDETFAGAASTILAADAGLFGGQNTALLNRIFHERGIRRDLTPPADFSFVVDSIPVQVEPERENGTYFNGNTDIQEIKVPGAQGLRLRFAQVDTELNEECVDGACDNIYLLNKDGLLFQILNGTASNVSSVVIPGDTVQIRMVSDFTQTQFGYVIDQVEVMGISPGATCGNGSVEVPESCDALELQGASCQSLGFDAGALACNNNCTFDASQCTGQSTCGDNIIDAGEECDGANVNGQVCTEFGFDAGNVACNADCTIDLGECSDCGDGIKSGAEACDGLELGATFCETVGLSSGFLRCSGACTFDTSACLPPRCE